MGMNPETNKFEPLHEADQDEMKRLTEQFGKLVEKNESLLVRSDGSPVPRHWATFKVGEFVVIKGYTFRVGYIGESSLLFEPVKPSCPACESEVSRARILTVLDSIIEEIGSRFVDVAGIDVKEMAVGQIIRNLVKRHRERIASHVF